MKPIKNKFIFLFHPHPIAEGLRMTPLALLSISSLLEKEYDIRIFHSYDKDDYLEALAYLDRAVCVGITILTGYQITDGLKFAKLVREKNSKVPIVWGGTHATIEPVQTVKSPYVDIVVKGQGEETFAELVRALDNKKPLDGILGIVYKKDGQVIDNPNRPYKSINDFPPVPYHLLGETIQKYIKKNAYADRNLLYVTSVGCPFRCRFCYLGNPIFSQAYDAYPAERVVRELKNLVDSYQLTGVEIRDSNFFVNEKRCREIFAGLIRAGVKLTLSVLCARASQFARFSDDFLELMKAAGAVHIEIGAESGDQEMLDFINKKLLIKDIVDCERKAKRFGIKITNLFITGFPIKEEYKACPKKQLRKELYATIDLIVEIFKINPVADVLLFFYTPYPGALLYEESLKAGFKSPQSLEGWGSLDLANLNTPWVDSSHKRKVLFLRKLFLLKKLSSDEYFSQKAKTNRKIYWLYKLRAHKALGALIDFRLRTKFLSFPFEKWLFALARILK
jgi:radical SAM superfamily enzyme YgiQ (UPF0313 family)